MRAGPARVRWARRRGHNCTWDSALDRIQRTQREKHFERESIPEVKVWFVLVEEVRARCSVRETRVQMCREKGSGSWKRPRGREARSCCEMRVSRFLFLPTVKSPK